MATKTVSDMPNHDKVSARKTGDSMIEPVGPVGKGSLGSASLAGQISASATPKATVSTPAPGQAADNKNAPAAQASAAKTGGGGMGGVK